MQWMMMLLPIAATSVPIIMFAEARLYAAVVLCLMIIFWTIITFTHLISLQIPVFMIVARVAYPMIPVLSLILLSVAPARAVSRRLIFLALGLLLLIALNELSKLGLDVIAPKLQG